MRGELFWSRQNNDGTIKKIFYTVFIFVILGVYCGADSENTPVVPRNRVYRLRHISAKDARRYLVDLQLGTDINELPKNALIVTSTVPADLVKASGLISVIDSEKKYLIKSIPAKDVPQLSANEQIEARVENILIGTLTEPPANGEKAKVIVDTLNSDIIVIAPQELLEIVSSSLSEPEPIPEVEEIIEPEIEEPEDDFFQAELLESLKEAEMQAEAEQAAAEKEMAEALRQLAEAEAEKPVIEKPVKETEPAKMPLPVEEVEEKEQEVVTVPKRSREPDDYLDQLTIAGGEKELETTLSLPEKVEITALLELVGKQLGLNYIYDTTKVKGEVTLKIHDGKIKVKDTYALLESVLRFRDFVMTRRGNLVTIVPKAEAMSIDPTIRIDADKIQPGDVIVTSVFKLKHITTDIAETLLKSMGLGAEITSIAETGTLIVTEYAYRIGRIEDLLTMVDLPGEPRKFSTRKLQYTKALETADKVKVLADQLGTVSITVSGAKPSAAKPAAKTAKARRTKAPAKTTDPKKIGQAPSKEVYLDADERTNRILIIGPAESIETVNELIDALDIEREDLRTIQQYEIQHVNPEDVKDKLVQLGIISSTGRTSSRRTDRTPTKGKASSTARSTTATAAAMDIEDEPQVVILESTNSLLVNATAAQHIQIAMIIAYVDAEPEETAMPYIVYFLENQDPVTLAETINKLKEKTVSKDSKIQGQTQTSKEEDQIIIVPDEKTFSLIVYANRKNQQWIGSLIKSLDKYMAQVLIDVTLVEITKDDTFQYDLDIVTKLPSLRPGESMDKLVALVDPFPSGSIVEGTARTSTGAAKGFYADRHIQALLTLMQTKKYGRVLAQPKILVNDNEEGTINTDRITYVARSSESATPAGETVVTSTTTFDEFTSGIELTITPHISQGDLLRLDINMTRSQQESASGAVDTPPPDKTDNIINTIVTVPDKSTIILGGVQELDQNKDGNKVPFLGDLPLVGVLFRGVNNTDTQTRMYIFVKANILRPSETESGLGELIAESDTYRTAFEQAEQDWQEHEQWQGVKPKPIDPLKLLDVK